MMPCLNKYILLKNLQEYLQSLYDANLKHPRNTTVEERSISQVLI